MRAIAILNDLDCADAKVDDHVGFALCLARDLASGTVAQQFSYDLKVAPVPRWKYSLMPLLVQVSRFGGRVSANGFWGAKWSKRVVHFVSNLTGRVSCSDVNNLK